MRGAAAYTERGGTGWAYGKCYRWGAAAACTIVLHGAFRAKQPDEVSRADML